MDDTSAQQEWLAEVGMRVRVARVRRRETQEQLAAQAAVSRVTLGSIERGDHEAGASTDARLARILSLSRKYAIRA